MIQTEKWNFTANPEFGYIPYLDGLRAVAVLIVLGRHLGFSDLFPGGFGVTIFFFLSGFLISRLLLSEANKFGSIHVKNFYIRRLFRLMPALLVMLAVSFVVLAMVLDYAIPVSDVFASIFYYMNYYLYVLKESGDSLAYGGWTVLWSLAVEEHFYILFPLFLLAFIKKKELQTFTRFVFLLILCSIVLRFLDWFFLSNASYYVYGASETRMESILWGVLLTVALAIPTWRAFFEKYLFHPALFWLALIALVGIFLIRDDMFQATLKFTLQGFLLFIVFFQIIFTQHHLLVKSILENVLLKWVGKVSYSLYLWHIFVFTIVSSMFSSLEGITLATVSLMVSFAVAWLSFKYIEVPMHLYGKRWFNAAR